MLGRIRHVPLKVMAEELNKIVFMVLRTFLWESSTRAGLFLVVLGAEGES